MMWPGTWAAATHRGSGDFFLQLGWQCDHTAVAPLLPSWTQGCCPSHPAIVMSLDIYNRGLSYIIILYYYVQPED